MNEQTKNNEPENKGFDGLFCIQITNSKNQIGFVIKAPNNQILVTPQFDVRITFFKTKSAANECIEKYKIAKRFKVKILSGEEMAEKFGRPIREDETLHVIKNEKGEFLKYNSELNNPYYFETGTKLTCLFKNEDQANEAIEKLKPSFNVSEMTAEKFKP